MSSLQSLRPSPRILLSGLIGGAATASGIALTATSGWLIVRASERPIILTLLVAVVGVRAFGIARPVLRYVERLISHDEALGELAGRRAQMYAALVPLTPARLGRRSRSSVLAGVVDDITDVVEAQVRVTVPVMSGVVAGVLGAILAALLNPTVGLIVAGMLLVIAGSCYLAYLLERSSQAELLAARARVQQVSDLVAGSSLELQAIGAEADARSWLVDAHRAWAAAVRRQSRGRALAAAIILTSTGIAAAGAAWIAAQQVGSAPVAALLIVLPVALGDGLAPLAEAMRALARAEGAQQRITDLLDQVPAVAPAGHGIPAPLPELTTDAVQASWRGERMDMPEVTLSLAPGTSLGITGPNGAGKSTLLAVLARHLDPAAGRYALSGDEVRDLELGETRARFAIVDDEPHVFASSARNNLLLANPEAGDADLIEGLERAGLRGLLAELPEGLDTVLGSGGRGLSGGERARLAIARAVVSRRPVVLLDEPVAHLDHATAVAVLRDLREATADRTVVLVSHRHDGLDELDMVIEVRADQVITTTCSRVARNRGDEPTEPADDVEAIGSTDHR
ncbi:MAG: thiol reductant ABC exporter subunit CydC [Actinomycetales bacterium]|nr:thiol reductant ABC exporter subunit CydC [Actinomycetales bacterium]